MTLSPTATEALCITGDPRSGKTGTLVERAVAWAEAAPATPDAQPPLLFFCASPVTTDDAALRLSQRGLANVPVEAVGLAEPAACQHGPRTGLVTTPFDYACRILADPRAQRAIGRGGRVLSRAEEAVFYEDLKTCGLKRRRLRELWAFLQCGLANLNDGDPNWIQTTEERAILDLARDILAFEDAILPGEVVNLAVHALEVEPTLRQRFGSPVVLADDYLLMSPASQRLVNLLATSKIAVAGSEKAALPAFEPYPCATGFEEFEAAHAPLQRVTLEAPFHALDRAWEAAPDLAGEMGLIARTIAEELAGGTSPGAIAVVCVNRTWRANLQRALASVGIPAASLGHAALKAPKGDLVPANDDERERVLRQLRDDIVQPTGLRESRARARADMSGIASHNEPSASPCGDSIAWRQWLSFDDALGRSAAVSELRRVAQPQGLNLAEALAALDADTLPGLPATSPFAQSLLAPLPRSPATARGAERGEPTRNRHRTRLGSGELFCIRGHRKRHVPLLCSPQRSMRRKRGSSAVLYTEGCCAVRKKLRPGRSGRRHCRPRRPLRPYFRGGHLWRLRERLHPLARYVRPRRRCRRRPRPPGSLRPSRHHFGRTTHHPTTPFHQLRKLRFGNRRAPAPAHPPHPPPLRRPHLQHRAQQLPGGTEPGPQANLRPNRSKPSVSLGVFEIQGTNATSTPKWRTALPVEGRNGQKVPLHSRNGFPPLTISGSNWHLPPDS